MAARPAEWLRVDRGLDTYALQGCDSPRLIPIPADGSTLSKGRLQRAQSEPLQRWWLRDVTHDKSLGKGMYELFTGLLQIHPKPDRSCTCLGAMRSGTRFIATPHVISGSVWLKVHTDVSPPLFTLTTMNRESQKLQAKQAGKSHSLFATSGQAPLSPSIDPMDLEDVTEIWVEDNKQYVKRLRDLDRENGLTSYSVCLGVSSPSKAMPRRRRPALGP